MSLAACSRKLGLLLGCISLTACGGGDGEDEDGADGTGTVHAPWTEYCTATFTDDTPIEDPFGDVTFTARAGDSYLLGDYSDGYTEILFLTDVGPDTFQIEPNAAGAYPFTSNCALGEGVPYYAAFTNVAVFAEEALTTKLCDIAAGTALPAGGGTRFYAATSFNFGGPSTYEVGLDAFSAQCAGAQSGFISVPHTELHGSGTWLVPLVGIIGPQ